jgi:hypothetical protein
MLRGEYFRGGHQRDLIAIFDDDGGGFQGDDGFAAADIAFEKAVHRKRAFKIGGDFNKDALLRRSRLEGQDAFHGIADVFLANAHSDAALTVVARTTEGESELIVEKFFEDETGLRGTAKTVELLYIFIFGREVGEKDRVATRRKFVAFANLRRKRVGNIALKIGEDAVNNFAKHARANCADGFVDGNDAANLGGIGGGAFGCADGFNLGVYHFQAGGTVGVDFHFAMQDETLAFFHTAFEICAVEKARVKSAGPVAKCGVEDGRATASEANGGASAGSYFSENCVNLPRDNFGNFGEADAIFVTEWEIAEQVAGGEESALFENGGAVGADASEKFDGSCQGDGHGSKYLSGAG